MNEAETHAFTRACALHGLLRGFDISEDQVDAVMVAVTDLTERVRRIERDKCADIVEDIPFDCVYRELNCDPCDDLDVSELMTWIANRVRTNSTDGG
jgi:hypothetical protein